jgi:endoglucanase
MGLRTSRAGKSLLAFLLLLMVCATGGCKQGPWVLWNAYETRFIDQQGRVFDPQGDQHSTSEGQAYALFFALADNDRAQFDRVLNWTQVNMAKGDLTANLPAWLWGKDKDGAWKTLDANSASDADLWMAYTLVEAGRLWNAPVYTSMGKGMMARIAATEVADLPGFGLMLLPGPIGFAHETALTNQAPSSEAPAEPGKQKPGKHKSEPLPLPANQSAPVQTFLVNPSYLPAFLFARLESIDPAGPWREIGDHIPLLLSQSARHGFAMDWVEYVPGDGFHPVTQQQASGGATEEPGGSYDAIRVYLWAGMMAQGGGMRDSVFEAVPGMGVYLADHGAPPEKVSDQGVALAQDGPVGFSAALLPYLKTYPGLTRIYAQQRVRMSQFRDGSTGLYGKDLTYYDQNLALFATGFLDGVFQFGPKGDLKVEWKRR